MLLTAYSYVLVCAYCVERETSNAQNNLQWPTLLDKEPTLQREVQILVSFSQGVLTDKTGRNFFISHHLPLDAIAGHEPMFIGSVRLAQRQRTGKFLPISSVIISFYFPKKWENENNAAVCNGTFTIHFCLDLS